MDWSKFSQAPLPVRLMIMEVMADIVTRQMEKLLTLPEITMSEIDRIGLRQAVRAGEGEPELFRRCESLSGKVDRMRELVRELEAHVQNVRTS